MQANKSQDRFVEMSRVTLEILSQAFTNLEHGKDTKDSRLALKEIARQLQELEFEYTSCNW